MMEKFTKKTKKNTLLFAFRMMDAAAVCHCSPNADYMTGWTNEPGDGHISYL